MKISLITISYNSAATIEDTFRSVESQDYNNIEYIVIDGGSTDGTIDIIQKYQHIISDWVSEPDGGLYDAINKGIKRSTGEVIGLIHADDMLASSDVISMVELGFDGPHYDAIYADLNYVDHSDTNKIVRRWISGRYKRGDFKKGWMPPHPTLYVRKECYEDFGLYNTSDFRSAADYEFMLRLIHKHEAKLNYLPMTTVLMRVGGVSNASLKNRLRANKEDYLAWKINGLRPPAFLRFTKPGRKLIQYLRKG